MSSPSLRRIGCRLAERFFEAGTRSVTGLRCLARLTALLTWLTAVQPASLPAQGYPKAEAAARMQVADGLEVTLFAAEPEVRQPIFCKCDDRGRLWTIQYLQYPNPEGLKRVQVDRFSRTVYDRKPEPPPHGPRGADRITILEDADHDGRADRFHDFVDGLNLCTGVEFGHGGVYVLQVPYLLFYPDRDRNDRPDGDPEVLLDGFGMEDSQSLANHLTWGPDGWLYGLNGSTTTCRIRGIEFQQGVWRYHPRTKAFELFCEGGSNVYGLTFDRRGELYYSSNGGLFWHALQGGYFEKNFGKHGPLHNPHAYGFLPHVRSHGQTGRPNTGGTIYTGTTFPKRFHDAFLCGDFLTHTASWWTLKPQGCTVEATLGGHWLDARDTWFGATDLCLGPDGAMYCCDFHDQRTAHPDPDAQWDRSNGRIYRIQAKGAPPIGKFDLTARESTELIGQLSEPNGWMADQARRILGEREDPIGRHFEDRILGAPTPEIALQHLWAVHVCEGLEPAMAQKLLNHPMESVRAWVVRLLGDSGTATPEIAALLIRMARSDSSPAVRLQLACSARRWPAPLGLDLLFPLMRTAADEEDPRFDWSCWWSLESFAIPARTDVLRRVARDAGWSSPFGATQMLRLLRRYAAEGTPDTYAACATLWGSAPPIEHDLAIVEALTLGLRQQARPGRTTTAERADADAAGDGAATATRLEDSAGGLRLLERIENGWRAEPTHPGWTRLALAAHSEGAYADWLARLQALPPAEMSPEDLALLADYGREDSVPVVLPLIASNAPEPVRRAALSILRKHPGKPTSNTILSALPAMPATLQTAAREALLATEPGSLALLREVDAGRIAAKEIPTAELGPLEFQKNEESQRLVRKHWGQVRAATPEEKLAEVRRLQNDLRAGTGNAEAGRLLFRKHCATCHKLQGEGVPLGPDLTGTVQGDLTSLLTNIVDPSAVIRTDYVVQVVVTKSGTVQTGLLAGQDAASVTLVDARNERHRLLRDEIDEWRESPASLMPEKLLSPLAPQELRDLVAFLRTPPATPKEPSSPTTR